MILGIINYNITVIRDYSVVINPAFYKNYFKLLTVMRIIHYEFM